MLKVRSIAELENAICGFSREARDQAVHGSVLRPFWRSKRAKSRSTALDTSYISFCAESLRCDETNGSLEANGRRAFDAGKDRPLLIVDSEPEDLVESSEEQASDSTEVQPRQRMSGSSWLPGFIAGTIALATVAVRI